MIQRLKEKKGLTLVELIVTIMILVIVITGVVSAIVFSQQVVIDNNEKEKISAQANETADLLIKTFKGTKYEDWVDTNGAAKKALDDLQSEKTTPTGPLKGLTFVKNSEKFSFSPQEPKPIQYKLEAVTAADVTAVGVTEKKLEGIKITVAVFYANGEKSIIVTGFAASKAIKTS